MNLATRKPATLSPAPSPAGGGANHLNYELIDATHLRRHEVEQFIARRFFEVHAARVSSFMPLLVTLFGQDDSILAAVGIRDAAGQALFLEYYLDAPVEQSLSRAASGGDETPREGIVEIGNLASINRFASRKLFTTLAFLLQERRFEWAVFTGCTSLRKLFHTLGIETFVLGRATQSSLPRDQQSWGGYYEDNPCVLAGRVRGARRLLTIGDLPLASGGLS